MCLDFFSRSRIKKVQNPDTTRLIATKTAIPRTIPLLAFKSLFLSVSALVGGNG